MGTAVFMCAFEIFWNPPQGVDHGKPGKLSLTEKKLFYDIKNDATGPIWPLKRHQNWCHSTKTRFRLSFLAPKRSQLPVLSHIWRQNGANFLRNLLSPPYRNLWASKTTLILRFFENTFWAASLLATRDCTQLALLPPYSNMKGKKATRIFKKSLY